MEAESIRGRAPPNSNRVDILLLRPRRDGISVTLTEPMPPLLCRFCDVSKPLIKRRTKGVRLLALAPTTIDETHRLPFCQTRCLQDRAASLALSHRSREDTCGLYLLVRQTTSRLSMRPPPFPLSPRISAHFSCRPPPVPPLER